MSAELDRAIEALLEELDGLKRKEAELKESINRLSVMNGGDPKFHDVKYEGSVYAGSNLKIRPDQFFGMGVATAAKEYLKMRGGAATAQEILDALKRGGFEFPEDWQEKHW